MEEVYVVKVKTRPEPSKLYPSERRYSAVTVGGLGLVHALLAVTSLLLATLGIAAEGVAASYGAGVALGVAGCVTAAVGILAWRRWYVDNNIRYFLVTSLVSGSAAIVCIILTAVALATTQEELARQHLSLSHRSPLPRSPPPLPTPLPLAASDPSYQDGVDLAYDDDYDEELRTNGTELIQKFILAFENRKNRSDFQNLHPNNETYLLKLDDYVHASSDEETPTVSSVREGQSEDGKITEPVKTDSEEEKDTSSPPADNEEHVITPVATAGGFPHMQYNDGRVFHGDAGKEVRNVLAINILIASFLELAWSLLSVRIAWKGVKNVYPEDDGNVRAEPKTEAGYLPRFMKTAKTTRERPDIISNHRQEVQRKMRVAVVGDEVDHYLPQEESSTEYQERVRRFLSSNSENAC